MRHLRPIICWRVFGLLAGLLIAVTACVAPAMARNTAEPVAAIRITELPPQALETLQLIRQGGPFPYDRDGVVFGNYEQYLPLRRRGYYREYTVNTPGLKHRGARRIVVGCEPLQPAAAVLRLANCRDGGEFYYTADHYRSFRRIVQ